jgi:DNA-binding XRE family transcriptional regulator
MITGNQVRAARAIIDLDQQTLATAAGINITTLVNLERAGSAPVTGLAKTLRLVVAALGARGVMIVPNGVVLAQQPCAG